MTIVGSHAQAHNRKDALVVLEQKNICAPIGVDVWRETYDDHNIHDTGAACAVYKPWLSSSTSYLLLYELVEDSEKRFPPPVCEALATKEAFVELLNEAEISYPSTNSSSSSFDKVEQQLVQL
jgi:hypothetical protein